MDAEQLVRRDGLDYGMLEAVKAARAWLEAEAPPPARIRVVGDDDSDGATSAHVISTALRRAGYEVEASTRPIHTERDAEAILKGRFDALVVADAGSSLIEVLDRGEVPVLVLDHHAVHAHQAKFVHEVNPRLQGGDRTWHVSASIVSTLFAAAWGERNWDLAFAGLAGGISDRQHLGGFRGLVGYCVDGAVGAGNVTVRDGLTLDGQSVLDAVTSSLDPFFADYTGQQGATEAMLERLGIDSALDPLKLSPQSAQTLAKHLSESLAARGVVADRMFPLYGTRLVLRHASEVPTVSALAKLLEATTSAAAHELTMRLLAGNPGAREEAEIIFRHRQRHLLEEIQRLRSDVHETPEFRWAESRDGGNTGVYAHTLLMYVFGDDRPFLVFAPHSKQLRISARGSPRLFLSGLDLSIALSRAAGAVGGHGGGHPGASGATIPLEKRATFLKAFASEIRRLRGSKP